jgi:Flp pilus assembly pilin Flp
MHGYVSAHSAEEPSRFDSTQVRGPNADCRSVKRLHRLTARLILGVDSARESAYREDGQALIEYALIVSLIAVVAVLALQTTGVNLHGLLNKIAGDS